MPQSYRLSVYIDTQTPILIARVFGAMPSDVLCDEFIRAYEKIGEPWAYDRLIDMRKFSGETSRADIERFARVWSDWTKGMSEGRKVAFVTHDPEETARSLAQDNLYPKDILRTFSTADEALDWLRDIKNDAAPPTLSA